MCAGYDRAAVSGRHCRLRRTREVTAVGADSLRRTSRWWWERLARPDGATLPPSVHERLRWYEQHTPRARTAFYVLEVTVILVSAAIPASTAAGASAAT